MRIIITLAAVLLVSLASGLEAQTRYLDRIFSEVGEPTTEVYGANVDVFLQAVNNLEVDVYEPVGDTASSRPVVVIFPTGNFLLQYLNRGPYGSRRDSAVMEVVDRVVSRGYVGMVAEYRTGWLASSPEQEIRTSTLLQAAYRGGQDAHTLARYLRKQVVEADNPFGIDTSRIVYFGL
ncbi:MAG: hypothetical protein AAFN92_23315, partial [Bacteroidota bacterium]